MKRFLVIILVLSAGISTVQAQCPEAQSFIKIPKDKTGYGLSSQTKTGNLKSGESYETSFIAQSGIDYRISIKAQNESVAVSYEIYELVVVKKVNNGKTSYQKEKQVLFSSNDPEKEIEFSSEGTHKLFVSLTVAGGENKTVECIGVLIEQKRSAKIGF